MRRALPNLLPKEREVKVSFSCTRICYPWVATKRYQAFKSLCYFIFTEEDGLQLEISNENGGTGTPRIEELLEVAMSPPLSVLQAENLTQIPAQIPDSQ